MQSINSIIVLIIRGGNLALVLITGVILARVLGPDEYGAYSFVLAIISLLAVLAAFGLPELVTRNISSYLQKKDYGRLVGLSVRSLQLTLVASLFSSAIAIVWLILDETLNFSLIMAFIVSLLVPIQALSAVRGGALRGLGHVKISQLPEMLFQPTAFLIAIALVWYFQSEITSIEALFSRVVAALLALMVGTILLVAKWPKVQSSVSPIYETARWLDSAKSFVLISALWVVLGQSDIIILGLMSVPADVGVYKVAVTAGSLVLYVLLSVNTVIGPTISSAYAAGDAKELQLIVKRASRFAVIFSLPIAVLLITFGQQLLSLVFGEEYTAAYAPLIILTLAHLFNAAMGSVALTLNMTGHEKLTFRSQLFAVIFNVLLNIILIPFFGIVGAAVATAVAIVISNSFLVFHVWKKLGFNPTVFGYIKYRAAS
ncbi:MAG: flippase [Gammaproteobacteria bacterium]|nr:flippase [Gammaproteobacteria bacterium]